MKPLAIANSGGVSLGSDQGGYLHYFMKWNETNRRYDPRIITGASAGAINALTSAYYSFYPVPQDIKSSYFHRWVGIGFNSLLQPSRSALLSQEEIEKISHEFLSKWFHSQPRNPDKPKRIMIGITATRVKPRTIYIKDMPIPKQDEKFQFLIQWIPAKKRWRVDNLAGSEPNNGVTILDFGNGEDTQKIIAQLTRLILASSAYPVAFKPVQIEYLLVVPSQCQKKNTPFEELTLAAAMSHCPEARMEKANFVDGGLFENVPIRLAQKVAETLRDEEDSAVSYEDKVQRQMLVAEDAKESLKTLFVDPHHTTFPKSYQRQKNPPKYFLPLLGTFATGYLSSNFDRELALLRLEDPDIDSKVIISKNRLPVTSAFFANFFGFFERDFREFDFVVGMYDAYMDARSSFGDIDSAVTWDPVLVEDKRLQCLIDVNKRLGDSITFDDIPACTDSGKTEAARLTASFRTILQVSLIMRDIYEETRKDTHVYHAKKSWYLMGRKYRPPTEDEFFSHLEAIKDGNDLDVILDLLHAYGYAYQDLAKGKLLPMDRSKSLIAYQLVDAGNKLIDSQKSKGENEKEGGLSCMAVLGSRALLHFGANAFHYNPQPWHMRVDFGSDGFFATFSHAFLPKALPARNWLKLDWVFEMREYGKFIPGEYGLLGGLTFQLPWLSNAALQTRVSHNAGGVWDALGGKDHLDTWRHESLTSVFFADVIGVTTGWEFLSGVDSDYWHDNFIIRIGFQL